MGLLDWLKRRRQQPSPDQIQAQGPARPVVKSPTGHIGHGRHFYFLQQRGDPYEVANEIATEIMSSGKGVGLQHGDLFHITDGRGDLMFSFLGRAGEFLTAYPYDDNGFGWPIKVKEIYPWPNGVEGQVVGSCKEARVGLFDTLFFRNKDAYDRDVPLTFLVNGLAYKLFEGEVPRGFSADYTFYIPLTQEEEGGVDEVKFSSKVEAVEDVDFWGIPLIAYTLTLAVPEDFPLRLRMYSHASAGPRRFRVGDRLAGYAWLFGFAKLDHPA